MISREKFKEILEYIHVYNQRLNDLNIIMDKLCCDSVNMETHVPLSCDFYPGLKLVDYLIGTVTELCQQQQPQALFDDAIEYYIFELEWGSKWTPTSIIEKVVESTTDMKNSKKSKKHRFENTVYASYRLSNLDELYDALTGNPQYYFCNNEGKELTSLVPMQIEFLKTVMDTNHQALGGTETVTKEEKGQDFVVKEDEKKLIGTSDASSMIDFDSIVTMSPEEVEQALNLLHANSLSSSSPIQSDDLEQEIGNLVVHTSNKGTTILKKEK